MKLFLFISYVSIIAFCVVGLAWFIAIILGLFLEIPYVQQAIYLSN